MTSRVLLVEDSDVLRRLVDMCLTPTGVEVDARVDGASGLEAAMEGAYDIIILDLGLPVMDGWEVLERLRSDPVASDVPIVLLSADTSHESRARAVSAGATAFLAKPFRTSELRSTVLRLVAQNV